MEVRGGGDKSGFRTASEVKNDKMTLVTIQINERRKKDCSCQSKWQDDGLDRR